MLALALWLTPAPASAEVLVLTADSAVRAADVRIDGGGKIAAINRDGTTAAEIASSEVKLIRFDVRWPHNRPRAWLCMHDGRRISGDSLKIGPDRVDVVNSGAAQTSVSRGELAALFFKARLPELTPPAAGVRVISTNGDKLDAPEIELTDAGVYVDIDPGAEPIPLPRERVAGVIWPARAAGGAAVRDPDDQLIELRTGERLVGRVASLDGQTLVVARGDISRTIQRREVRAIWFGRHDLIRAEDQIAAAPASDDRPGYRRGFSALGSPLRVGRQVYRHGLGLRGPASIDVAVPEGARWFLAQVGADADAARFARVSLEILVDGETQVRYESLVPGEPARQAAVFVGGAGRVTLRVMPSDGDDATGCLGDFADAMFIVE